VRPSQKPWQILKAYPEHPADAQTELALAMDMDAPSKVVPGGIDLI